MSHGQIPNPYKASGHPSLAFKATDKLKAPGICMIVVGAVALLMVLGFYGLTLIGLIADPNAGTPPPEMTSEAERTGFLVGFYGVLILPVFNIIAQIFVILAGINMVRGRGLGIARTGSVFAVIPCLSPFCFLGIPFGVWSLVVLRDARVKSSFK